MKKIKNELHTMKQMMYDMGHLTVARWLLLLLEGLEVQASYQAIIMAQEGPPNQKLKKK